MDADANRTAWTVYQMARLSATKYRHCTIEQAELTQSDFDNALKLHGRVVFTSTRVGHAHLRDSKTIWVLIDPNSGASREVKSFDQMWKALSIDSIAGLDNIVLLAEDKFKHHILNKLAGYSMTMPIYIELVNWNVFLFETPQHTATCRHEIVEPAEMETFTSRTFTDPTFPKILPSDPQIVWIGARVGDIIKIHVSSYSAGVAVSYRRVANG